MNLLTITIAKLEMSYIYFLHFVRLVLSLKVLVSILPFFYDVFSCFFFPHLSGVFI